MKDSAAGAAAGFAIGNGAGCEAAGGSPGGSPEGRIEAEPINGGKAQEVEESALNGRLPLRLLLN